MEPKTIVQTLAELPHFRMLERELVERIAAGAKLRTLAAGELLFTGGEPCRAFFAIRSGAVKLFRNAPDGRERVVHNLRAGQAFAEAALLSIGRYPLSAVATETPTELVEVAGAPFLELFRKEERVAAAMVASLSARLVMLVERVEELSLANAGSRLARWLARQPSRREGGGAPRVELSMAKKDLAAHLSMTPETLSRLLRRWQDERLIEQDKGAIAVLDEARLLAVADGTDPAAAPAA
jgi:CRP/FNR family transcriptional regulator